MSAFGSQETGLVSVLVQTKSRQNQITSAVVSVFVLAEEAIAAIHVNVTGRRTIKGLGMSNMFFTHLKDS